MMELDIICFPDKKFVCLGKAVVPNIEVVRECHNSLKRLEDYFQFLKTFEMTTTYNSYCYYIVPTLKRITPRSVYNKMIKDSGSSYYFGLVSSPGNLEKVEVDLGGVLDDLKEKWAVRASICDMYHLAQILLTLKALYMKEYSIDRNLNRY